MKRCYPVATIAMSLTALSAPTWAQSSDAVRGERMYRACVACHSLEPNRNMTGPSLAEVWNRQAGSLASFPRYSPALKSAGIIWNDDTLDEWIKDPQHFIPGNTMTFPGMKDERPRRRDLRITRRDQRIHRASMLNKRNSLTRRPSGVNRLPLPADGDSQSGTTFGSLDFGANSKV